MQKIKNYILVFIYSFCIFLPNLSFAQIHPKFKADVTYKVKTGFIIPHSPVVRELQNGIFDIHEIHVENKLWGSKHANKNLPKPIFGFYFSYSNYNNPNLLGNIFAVIHYAKFTVFKYNFFSVQTKLGTGVAFIQNGFDRETNFRNLVIGGNWNNQTDFVMDFAFDLSKKSSIILGYGAQHNSNGALRRPNLGLNIPYVSLAFHYKFLENLPKREFDPSAVDTVKYQFYTQFTYGQKKIFWGDPTTFYKFNFAPGIQFNLKKNRFLNMQMDFFYDTSIPYLKDYEFEIKPTDKWLISPFVSYEKVYGNLGIVFGLGYYVHAIYDTFGRDLTFANRGGNFTNRGGLKYYFKNWYLNAYIYAHSAEADNFEFGFGKRW